MFLKLCAYKFCVILSAFRCFLSILASKMQESMVFLVDPRVKHEDDRGRVARITGERCEDNEGKVRG